VLDFSLILLMTVKTEMLKVLVYFDL